MVNDDFNVNLPEEPESILSVLDDLDPLAPLVTLIKQSGPDEVAMLDYLISRSDRPLDAVEWPQDDEVAAEIMDTVRAAMVQGDPDTLQQLADHIGRLLEEN